MYQSSSFIEKGNMQSAYSKLQVLVIDDNRADVVFIENALGDVPNFQFAISHADCLASPRDVIEIHMQALRSMETQH
jgi:hypothetical protein